jgi:ferredoxin/flavodoxin---NADP+ reductase
MSVRAAVVGAGPSGFYVADQLLKEGIAVDLFDALPTPYGLVRAGVAPDHPKIKSVTRMYEKTATHPDFRFFGGVELGADVAAAELLERYHAVVYAVGTPTGNRLGIPGDDRPGSIAATQFVAWYNGHPAFADEAFDLSCSRAVVVGNGNVALDVARMLVLDPDELAATDTADHALAAFAAASVTDVVLLGRRGPAQAAFTNPELRELGELERADVVVDPAELELDPASAEWLDSDDASPTARRNVAMLREYAARRPAGRSHRIELRFCRSPVEVVGDGDGPVTGLRVVRNRLEPDPLGGVRAVATGAHEVIPCGLVIRSIGYRGRPLPGVPFDERRGLIRNDGGRVCDEDGTPRPGEYAVGWVKRGPSGVIGTNKKCAADTVAALLEDLAGGRLNESAPPDGAAVEAWLRTRVPGLVTWDGWQAIDEHERSLGAPKGRPRVKLVRLPQLRAVAAQKTGVSV